jgi:cysteine/glycine-rich protein
MAFSGTQQKCKACDKTVYLVEQLTADGVIYHKSCFRCNHCKGTLKVSLLVSVSASLFWYYFFLPLPCSFRVEKSSKPQ